MRAAEGAARARRGDHCLRPARAARAAGGGSPGRLRRVHVARRVPRPAWSRSLASRRGWQTALVDCGRDSAWTGSSTGRAIAIGLARRPRRARRGRRSSAAAAPCCSWPSPRKTSSSSAASTSRRKQEVDHGRRAPQVTKAKANASVETQPFQKRIIAAPQLPIGPPRSLPALISATARRRAPS